MTQIRGALCFSLEERPRCFEQCRSLPVDVDGRIHDKRWLSEKRPGFSLSSSASASQLALHCAMYKSLPSQSTFGFPTNATTFLLVVVSLATAGFPILVSDYYITRRRRRSRCKWAATTHEILLPFVKARAAVQGPQGNYGVTLDEAAKPIFLWVSFDPPTSDHLTLIYHGVLSYPQSSPGSDLITISPCELPALVRWCLGRMSVRQSWSAIFESSVFPPQYTDASNIK